MCNQLFIYVGCSHRLCVSHILAHRSALLAEADELRKHIKKLAEYLNISFSKIQTIDSEAMNVVDIWWQRQIDRIEDNYVEKILVIESKEDYFVELENKLSRRLVKDTRELLKCMQTQN